MVLSSDSYSYFSLFIKKIFKILLISFILILIPARDLLAAENLFSNIQEHFLQDRWVESRNELVLYMINFHKIDNMLAKSLAVEAYFTDEQSNNEELKWSYSQEEGLMEIIGLVNRNNKITINTYQSLLNSEGDYTSWLLSSRNRRVEMSLEEKYIGIDEIKKIEYGLLLEISITPNHINYENREILSEIEFYFGSISGENRLNTTVVLEPNSLKDIGVAARKVKTDKGYQFEYYSLQMAAAVISADELAEINQGIVAIGDISRLNRFFNKNNRVNTYHNRSFDISFSNIMMGIKYKNRSEKYDYQLGLNKYYEKEELEYLINGRFYLDELEKLALSFNLGNEIAVREQELDGDDKLYLPVFRLGFYDEVKWTDNFTIGISYYPLKISKGNVSNHLWHLTALYQRNYWNIKYESKLLVDEKSQEISLGFLFNEENSISINYGMDYKGNNILSVTYSLAL